MKYFHLKNTEASNCQAQLQVQVQAPVPTDPKVEKKEEEKRKKEGGQRDQGCGVVLHAQEEVY